MVSRILLSFLFVLAATSVANAQPGPVPVIERIEPTSGPPGTTVEIIGRRIHPHSQILLGSQALEVLRRLPNRWTVRIPADARSGNLVVQTRWGSYRGPYFRVTTARTAPVVERIVPTEGPPGTEVTIHGQHFSPRLMDNTVTLSGRPVVVRSATSTTLDVIVPTGASSGPFVVRVDQAGEVSTPTFTVTAGTAIASFTPRIGPPGTQVTLTGTGFSASRHHNRVFINNLRARVDRASPTELVVTLPANAATGPIVVDVRGAGRAQTDQPFTVQQLPVITSVTPAEGPPSAQVTIVGRHFGSDPRHVVVTLAGRPVVLRAVTGRRIIVEIPAGATSGKLAVTVNGLGPVEHTTDFRVLMPVSIAGFEPQSGPVGSVVTIRGQGFSAHGPSNQVTIGHARAQVLDASPTELRVRVPSTPSGPITVSVRNSGSDRTSSPFVVTQPPFISTFAPHSGPPGTVVTIRGRNFGTSAALVTVTLDGRPMQVRTVADDRITAAVPAGATSGMITVNVRLQGGAATSAMFTVTGAPPPPPPQPPPPPPSDGTVRVISVAAECNRGGCHAVLRGTGFSTRVRQNRVFWGTRPVRVDGATPTELRITLPVGSGANPFRVDVRGGGEAHSQPFTIVR